MRKGKKSLAETHPDLVKLWHPSLNGDLTPYNVTKGSNKKVWWKCPKEDDHIWQKPPNQFKYKSSGCPMCSGKVIVKSNSLASINPNLFKEWYHPLNKLDPYKLSPNSHKKVWWKCPKGDDHIYEASIKNKNLRGDGCSVCKGTYLVKSTTLKYKFPNISKEWHPTKNIDANPENIHYGSHKKVWWRCIKDNEHLWKASVIQRTRLNTECPYCDGQRISNKNSLLYKNPIFLKEWHPTKNSVDPKKIGVSDNKRKIWWKCSKCEHEWRSNCNNRSKGKGCPLCTLTPQSKQELTITFELMKLFKNIDPKGLKIKLEGRLRAIDIFIPKLNLCIEFDGSYWHKDKRDIDKIKSEMLFDDGFKLIRVRQEPLKKIYDTDVISKQPYNGKQVTNDILSKIINIFNLDNKLVSKIKDYQLKDKLQNEKVLERYIDKILTEKVEKKSN